MDVLAQLTGYPRIGPNRELKWALERRWAGRMDPADFAARLDELREAHLDEQRHAIGSAVDDYFVYDEVLETALMFGIAPEHDAARIAEDAFDVLTSLARGTPEREAWEMTKWFDTNYHYVVPEIEGPVDALRPLPWREPIGGPDVAWSILGPYSLVQLSKVASGVDRLELARSIGEALWAWCRERAEADQTFRLQLDEPCLGLVMDDDDMAVRDAAYDFASLELSEPPLVTVQFGDASGDTIEALGRKGFVVQMPVALVAELRGSAALETQPELAIAVMDGRSVWPDDFEVARRVLAGVADDRVVRLIPSTSFMFLPYTVDGEDLPAGFQFAREKARALAGWPDALMSGGTPPAVPQPERVEWPEPGKLQPRAPRADRRAAQVDLNLPPFPTTTTGSLPQTTEVRHLRVKAGRGEMTGDEYDAAIARLISDSVEWQERIGLDVLVHGEFERTDMVEYFAEQMHGFHTTRNGWVLSYGSRCVRAPILAAPPSISEPMTVDEWRVAQDRTDKPVKGMLTGPVTIVNWSFRPPNVPDDRLFWAVAQPIAEEVRHLVDAGCRVIQVDEPAVRERWPLRTRHADRLREIYARGVRAALNHVYNQPPQVQMHTHMCYGDFGDIVPLWSDAGVDVASVEFSRSKDDSYIRQFYGLFDDGHLQIGPGVFDVHSPHTPGRDLMTERLRHFRAFMDEADLWVNPDCGLKTRSWEEIETQLGDMVAAARELRSGA